MFLQNVYIFVVVVVVGSSMESLPKSKHKWLVDDISFLIKVYLNTRISLFLFIPLTSGRHLKCLQQICVKVCTYEQPVM